MALPFRIPQNRASEDRLGQRPEMFPETTGLQVPSLVTSNGLRDPSRLEVHIANEACPAYSPAMSGWDDAELAAQWTEEANASPARGEQLELLFEVIAALRPRAVLEVGIGSGLVAEEVLRRLPETQLVGVDFSEPMVALARDRLNQFADRVTFRIGDLARPDAVAVDEGKFDVIYSVQALHHLEDTAKERALAWVGSRLAVGGFFLMRDKVAVPTEIFPAYAAIWKLHARKMPTEREAYDRYVSELRASGDIPATLDAHLEWLSRAGLTAAILHAEAHYFLLAARRGG